jgi:hypothetical protein
MNNINNLSALFYTSENHVPISKLSIDEFNKFSQNIGIKKYLVSNNIKHNLEFSDFQIINTLTPYCDGGTHFSEVMLKGLSIIDTEYVLFMLDDYTLFTDIKKENIEKLLLVMQDGKIDHLSFQSYNFNDWSVYNIDYSKYDLPDNILLNLNTSYRYMLSVQPSIWNRKSLIKLLESNEKLGLHHFDTSYVKNIKGELRHNMSGDFYETKTDFWDYGFKHICLNKSHYTSNYAFDDRNIDGDYFLFLYSEIIRFGKFNFNTHHNNRDFLEKFLNEKNITSEHPIYSKFF